jgi:hypothetical protein
METMAEKQMCRDDDRYACGDQESVIHVLLDCPGPGTCAESSEGGPVRHLITCQPYCEDLVNEGEKGELNLIMLHVPRRLRLSWT